MKTIFLSLSSFFPHFFHPRLSYKFPKTRRKYAKAQASSQFKLNVWEKKVVQGRKDRDWSWSRPSIVEVRYSTMWASSPSVVLKQKNQWILAFQNQPSPSHLTLNNQWILFLHHSSYHQLAIPKKNTTSSMVACTFLSESSVWLQNLACEQLPCMHVS